MKKLLLIFLFFIPVLLTAQESEEDERDIVYTSLEEAMKNPEKVYRLKLSKEKLEKFPVEIFKMTNLVELDLSRNKITEIPEEISALKNLEEINLSRNRITIIPAAFYSLNKLKRIHLSMNSIETILPAIRYLASVEYIDFWSNPLGKFPDELSELKTLKELDLREVDINDREQKRISEMLPQAKIHFSQSCNCSN